MEGNEDIAHYLMNYTNHAEHEKPTALQTWGVGFAVVTVSAFAAPLGIMFVPLLSNSLYERAMSLLVALGIGALSGSIMFIMLPQALEVTDYSSSEHLTKSLIVLGSLYGFFAVDRLIQFVMEAKRRYRSRHVGRDEGVTSNGGSSSCSASKLCSNEAAEVDDVISKEIEQIQADIEISSVNSAITRTFSCRRRTPFISTAEGCNTQTKSPSNTLQVPAIATIYSPGSTMPADVATEEECGKRVSVSVAVVEQIEVPRDKLKVASVAYMIILGSSANNLIDGMSNGVAFADSLVRGLSIGIACIAQQFPQEIGLGLKRTLLLDLIPAALSYTGFTIGAFLDNLSEGADNYVFSISSGMYLYVFLGTLIPEVRDSTNELIKTNLKESIVATLLQFVGISVGVTSMYFMASYSNKIHL
ncbi:Zinc transporter ZIP14 [Toxocara canis]|uniref:Zinc transporter ZIP14 n=1 Tax=Toxocara canis TaxID=6265 RepID=A0A0B2V8Q2_TOXCA|nr:Zinc transporter ZIP14 [Toxocara canis]